jgi:hypothetical protein
MLCQWKDKIASHMKRKKEEKRKERKKEGKKETLIDVPGAA